MSMADCRLKWHAVCVTHQPAATTAAAFMMLSCYAALTMPLIDRAFAEPRYATPRTLAFLIGPLLGAGGYMLRSGPISP